MREWWEFFFCSLRGHWAYTFVSSFQVTIPPEAKTGIPSGAYRTERWLCFCGRYKWLFQPVLIKDYGGGIRQRNK